MRLESGLCVLDVPAELDRQEVYGLWADEEGRRYLGGAVMPERMNEKFAELSAKPAATVWVAHTKDNGQFVGLFGLEPHHDGDGIELSYTVAAMMRGRGLATDVGGCLRDYALGVMGPDKVLAETQMANEPSRRLLTKLGFKLERTVERFGAVQGVFVVRG